MSSSSGYVKAQANRKSPFAIQCPERVCGETLGTALQTRSLARGAVKPRRSVMSTCPHPSGSFQSKHCTVVPIITMSSCMASSIPGQPLLHARPERQELKVLPLDVYGASDKPLRPKLHWVLPVVGVPPHGPDVDEKEGVGRDGVAAHHRVRDGLPWNHWDGWVETEHLLHHCLKVGQIGPVRLLNQPVKAHHLVNLVLGLPQHIRVVDELCYGPLSRNGCCVRKRKASLNGAPFKLVPVLGPGPSPRGQGCFLPLKSARISRQKKSRDPSSLSCKKPDTLISLVETLPVIISFLLSPNRCSSPSKESPTSRPPTEHHRAITHLLRDDHREQQLLRAAANFLTPRLQLCQAAAKPFTPRHRIPSRHD
ncbi:F-box family protein [Striga asiatica]|uniref:F-box family protein n=1 Tax=Striga asiatica TaxID=4170 RepID=A0A5A7P9D7_STRAF|nr:F-box family protein [Striga asiatica]